MVRFGVRSDDGYKVASSSAPDAGTPPLEFHNGGPADETFEVVVHQAGLYPFRLVWYERGGAAFVEWFTVNRSTRERTLINDPARAGAIKAYVEATRTQLRLQSAAVVTGPYTDDASAVINETARTVSVPVSGDTRFFHLVGGQAHRITRTQLQGATLVLDYE